MPNDNQREDFEVLAEINLSTGTYLVGVLESGEVGYIPPEDNHPKIMTDSECDLLRSFI
jgi:hypothetical protein